MLQNFEIFDKNGNIKSSGDDVWKKIGEDEIYKKSFAHLIKVNSIRIYLIKNIYGLRNKLLRLKGIKYVCKNNIKIDSDSEYSDSDSIVKNIKINKKTSEITKVLEPLIFDFHLNQETWASIQPYQVTYNNKKKPVNI